MNVYNETEVDSKEKTSVIKKLNKELVLYNDDVHTFDYVIEALMNVCKHSSEQAEQSAYLVHFNGKCSVKVGPENKLRPMKDALVDRDLRVKLL